MKFSSYFSYRDFLLSRRRGESGWSGRNRKRYKGVGVLDGTMESKISGIVSPVRSGAENKKKGRRSFLSSLCSIRGALGPCRPLTVRQPRLESLVWTGFLEFFSDAPRRFQTFLGATYPHPPTKVFMNSIRESE